MKPPTRVKLVKNDLDALIGYLLERGICDDTNFSIIKTSDKLWDVTFSGAEHISIALGDIEYSAIYRELLEKRSYNIKFLDGGLLQLMYSFNGEQLMQHRLAFYPSPDLRSFREDPDAYLRDNLFIDIVFRRIVPFPLRFDFDDREGVHVDMLHPRSHLTLGDAKGCRIPVSAPLTPRWFVEFILRNFYQAENHEFVSDLPNHQFNFEPSITTSERELLHMSVPV